MQKNRKISFVIVVLLVLTLFGSAVKDDSVILVVLHTNDTHGHPLKFYDYPANDEGGIPARATLVNNIRLQYENVLLLDAGDINTGRPESNIFKAEPDIKGNNYIGYNAVVFGNHEFDNQLDVLKSQMSQAKFDFISANVKTKDGKYLGKPYIIKDYNGFKVGVFGLTTKETEIVGNPDTVKNLVFADEIITAKKIVNELKYKVDFIIALTHMGIFENENAGSKLLAKEVSGINLIVDGHSHTKMTEPIFINNIPIIQDWQWGLTLGKAVIKIKNKKIVDINWEAVPVNLKEEIKNPDGKKIVKLIGEEIPEDKVILDELKVYSDKVDAILSEKIGESSGLLSNKNSRIEETALGDLVTDSMLWFVKNLNVDFAINNGGGIRADLPEGEITKRLIYEILPFDNSLVVVSLTGKELIELFNYIATIKQTDGAFPQVSQNISFTINYDKKICEDVLINGKPVIDDKIYKIATNNYLSTGGNGYIIFKNAKDRYDTSSFQREILIDYIKSIGGKITPEVKNRIKIIGSNMACNFILYYLIAA